MTIKLPTAIAAYFAADRERDAAAISRQFTESAVVRDDGEIHTGRRAIETWLSTSWKRYNANAEPFAIEDQGRATVVTSHVEGNFPGSPIDLRFHFVLQGGLISELEVAP